MMKILTFTIALMCASPVWAGCVADYKAKRDNPLELFFDVATISGPCTVANATAELRARLARQGMTLLKVVSVREN